MFDIAHEQEVKTEMILFMIYVPKNRAAGELNRPHCRPGDEAVIAWRS